MSAAGRVAILGGVRIPFARQNTNYAAASNLDMLTATLKDAVICALGTTMKKAGSQKSFYRVDHDLPVAFARAAQQRGAEGFALVSAIGASSSSRFFYPRTKGETESDVQSVGFKSPTILRPMIIEGEREESRRGESIVLRTVQILGPILPRRLRANPASMIARVALEAMVNPRPGVHVILSQDLTARG